MMGVRGIAWCWCVVATIASDSTTWTSCPEPTPGEAILVPIKSFEVTHLHLTYCNITSVGPSSLANVPNLEVIKLEKNNIRYFHVNAFKPTKKLKELYFLNNTILERTSAIELPDLEKIIFTHNDMSSVDFMLGQRLTTLELAHCSLDTVPSVISSSFHPNILKLVLSHNAITTIDRDTLGNVDTLQVLDLGYNNINDIHAQSFDSITDIETIILRNNRIKHIPKTLFQNKPHLMLVNLRDNLIQHLPSNLFESSSPYTIDLSYNMLIYLPDSFLPANYMTDETRNFDFYIDHNPWQCACLNEILVQLKRRYINYKPEDDNEFKGKEPACVMTNNFQCFKPEKHRSFYKKIKDGKTTSISSKPAENSVLRTENYGRKEERPLPSQPRRRRRKKKKL